MYHIITITKVYMCAKILNIKFNETNGITSKKYRNVCTHSRLCFYYITDAFSNSYWDIHSRLFRPILWDQSQFTMRLWIYHEILKATRGGFSGGFFAVKYQHFNLNMQTVTILMCCFNVLFGLKVLYWRKDNKADIKNCFICNLFPLKVKTCDQF